MKRKKVAEVWPCFFTRPLAIFYLFDHRAKKNPKVAFPIKFWPLFQPGSATPNLDVILPTALSFFLSLPFSLPSSVAAYISQEMSDQRQKDILWLPRTDPVSGATVQGRSGGRYCFARYFVTQGTKILRSLSQIGYEA